MPWKRRSLDLVHRFGYLVSYSCRASRQGGQGISMKACVRYTLISLTLLQGVATASAGEHATMPDPPAAATGAKSSVPRAIKDGRLRPATALDRVADAVDGAESSYGADLAMWRPDPSGPQGPMQVTSAAATDVGGGDRLDAM